MEVISSKFDLEAFKEDAKKCIEEPKNNLVLEKANLFRINPKEEIKPLESVVKLNGSIIGTLGNFSLIIGKAKSRKSFFLILLAASLLIDTLYHVFTGYLPDNKRKVLYFDTEQGKTHVQILLQRICRLTGKDNPIDIEIYHLRSLPPAERLEIIEAKIYSTQNLGYVFIDGIKDLITSINDEEQATMIASKLLKWTEELNIHISVVLHQNKGDNNARGHLGTELINKAETVLSVTKSEGNRDISIVNAEMCRNKEPEPFAFEISDNIPVPAENFEIRTETKKNRFDISEMEDFKIYKLFTEVYSKENQFGYAELVRQIKMAFKSQYDKSLGDNRIKEIITKAKNKNWVLQEKEKAPYKLGQYLN